MLAGGERVVIGVSGGADSVALFLGLRALAAEWRLTLHILHVDHQLRADSANDAGFVEALGRRFGTPVSVERVRVPGVGSLEAAARLVRHEALETAARRIGADRIALGHTADDQAETVLMRLLDGAGVRGLAAIPPVRGRIIRPLVETRRHDVEGALRGAGIGWIDDPSNRERKFLRNRIRHEILPLLAAVHGADVVPALTRTAALARQATDALDQLASRELERLARTERDGALTLPLDALCAMPVVIAPEVLRRAAARLGGSAPLRAWGHRGLARIVRTPRPRRPFRLGGVTVEVGADRVRLASAPAVPLTERTLPVPGRVDLPEIGQALEAVILDAAGYELPRGASIVAFDADDVPSPLCVRGRRRGDRFLPFGHPERRLKTLLIDAKVPRWDRARVPVVEAGGVIIWVAGIRRGAAAPVTRRTRRVLQLALAR
jgi:tRNA(Ile)-lysidine synthase